jgi:adenylate kinase family enzyme
MAANGLRLIMIGAPASGKGTQGERLAAEFGLPHVATGELLRRHVQEESNLGVSVAAVLEKGDLVPAAGCAICVFIVCLRFFHLWWR